MNDTPNPHLPQDQVTIVSINTDSIECYIPEALRSKADEFFKEMSELTGFEFEKTEYEKSVYLGVNSFLHIGKDGAEDKEKGLLVTDPGIYANPDKLVVARAVKDFYKNGTPARETIDRYIAEKDLYVFAELISGNAAILVDGVNIGNVARVYRSVYLNPPEIRSAAVGKAPEKLIYQGCRVFEDLEEWPDDLDRDYYIREAEEIIQRTSVPYNPATNKIARTIETAGLQTVGIGGARDIKTGDTFGGSRAIGVRYSKANGIRALPKGVGSSNSLVLSWSDNQGGGELHQIAKLELSTKEIRAKLKSIFWEYPENTGTVIVHGDGASFELVESSNEDSKLAKNTSFDDGSQFPKTNTEFLKGLFGASYEKAFVCSFECPPDTEDEKLKGKIWAGKPFRSYKKNIDFESANNFVAVSTFMNESRASSDFEALNHLMLDDIGTGLGSKATGDFASLGFDKPTAIIETSENNFQYVYKLREPITDRKMAKALLNAAVNNGILTVDSLSDVNRFHRLPFGINNKTKYKTIFKTRLVECDFSRTYSIDEIASWLKVDIALLANEQYSDDIDIKTDDETMSHPVPLAFETVGLLRSGAPGPNGWIKVGCPWEDEHSTKDDRAGVAIGVDGSWRFHCFHGHTLSKNDKKTRGAYDVYQWFKEQRINVPYPRSPFEGITIEEIQDSDPEPVVDYSLIEVIQRPDISGELPEPFPGVMTELCRAVLDVAPIPQPDLTTLAVLIGMSAACHGRYCLPSLMRLNLYGLGYAPTASGKDKPRLMTREIIRHSGGMSITEPASGEALQDQLSEEFLGIGILIDEIAHLLGSTNGKNVSAHSRSLEKILLQLFSLGVDKEYSTRAKAKAKGVQESRKIPHPTVSLLGFTTLEILRESITVKNVESGLLGRFIFGSSTKKIDIRRVRKDSKFPESAIDKSALIKGTRHFGNLGPDSIRDGQTPGEIVVGFTDEADQELDIQMTSFNELQNITIDLVFSAFVRRSYEKLERVAGVLAVWDNPLNPVITGDMVRWSGRLINASNEKVKTLVIEIKQSPESREMMKLVDIAKRLLSKELETRRPIGLVFLKNDLVFSGDLLWHSHKDKKTYQGYIDTLLAIGIFEEVRLNDPESKKTRGIGYRLNE